MKTVVKNWIGMATALALMIAIGVSATAATTFKALQGSMTGSDTEVTISRPDQTKALLSLHNRVTQIIPSHPTPDDEIVLKVQGTAYTGCGVPDGVFAAVEGDTIHVSTFWGHRLDGLIACTKGVVYWTRFAHVGRLVEGMYKVMASGDLDADPVSFNVEPAGIGGEIRYISPGRVVCHNLTTGQRVRIDMEEEDIRWDCEKMGLAVEPGDHIMQTILGTAD